MDLQINFVCCRLFAFLPLSTFLENRRLLAKIETIFFFYKNKCISLEVLYLDMQSRTGEDKTANTLTGEAKWEDATDIWEANPDSANYSVTLYKSLPTHLMWLV